MMDEVVSKSFSFGEYELDPAGRQLSRAGRQVALNAKAFDLLVALVENRGRVVTKEELMEQVWRDQFVEEANLTVQISALRKALGEKKDSRLFIATVPGRGYSFVAEVQSCGARTELVIESETTSRFVMEEEIAVEPGTEVVNGEDWTTAPLLNGGTAGLPALALSDQPKRIRSALALKHDEKSSPADISDSRAIRAASSIEKPSKRPARTILLAVIASSLAIGLGFAAYRLWSIQEAALTAMESTGEPVPLSIKSIAVLPFKPLVADSRDESLEMGMTETLITRLSGIKEVAVRSMSTVRRYNALDQDPIVAGREQKVDAVLDGHVQKTGERVRVTVRLLRISDAHTLWGDRFDGRLADIFALQDAISERVATAMEVKLTNEERQLLTKHYTDNTEAYQLYLKGRLFYRQWAEESIQKALECFDRAIAIDPNYALAYAGKSDVYSTNSSVFLIPAEAMPKAREAAHKALEMDDQLAQAHRSTAIVKMYADWDWAGAEREYKRALEIEPNNGELHASYAELLIPQKRFEEALVELKRARELDPLSLMVGYRVVRQLYFARQYDQALEQCREVVALYPNSPELHRALGFVLRQKGMYEDATRELRKAVGLRRHDNFLSELGNTYALAGQRDEAKKLVKELEELTKRRYVSPIGIARIYAGLGERDLVFKWLQKGYEDRSDHLLIIGVDPSFDGVHADPRFADLLRRIGLP